MRLPLRWLRDYIQIDRPPEIIADRLDALGFEVEAITRYGEGCRGLLAGRVLSYSQHPSAERLRLCQVEVGAGKVQEVVCGASNFSEGDMVAFAPVGAELPGGIKVEARTIRGVTSYGMICSESELGIGTDAEGILVLEPANAPSKSIEAGMPLEDVLGLGEAIVELDITPNRPDAMSVLGLARELAAGFGLDWHRPVVALEERGPSAGEKITLRNEDPLRCPRYIARYAEDVAVAPAPLWITSRLRQAGLRPINNVVDVTNFVLVEVGHPLHAFDYDLVEDGTVVVRRARQGEKLLCLDGELRTLDEDDLVIADATKPIALAGVIGGEETAINQRTSRVLLEAAYFEPTGILRTSKRHGIRTEASARFERGCDPEGAMWASERAASLLAAHCSARMGKGCVDSYPQPIERRRIELRCSKTEALLGRKIEPKEQARLLSSIELSVEFVGDSTLVVEVPTFRPDLSREVDLIEEIGRLAGYDTIPKTLPASRARAAVLDSRIRLRRKATELVRAAGFSEVKTFSLLSPSELLHLLEDPESVSRVSNPLRVEESVLRPTLVPGLCKAAARNLARRRQDVFFFEAGTVFGPAGEDGIPEEHRALAGIVVLAGGAVPPPVGVSELSRAPEFYYAKGAVETVANKLGIRGLTFAAATAKGMHRGRCATVRAGSQSLGVVGELSSEVTKQFDITERAAVFELHLDRLIELVPSEVRFEGFSKFPPVRFDLSFVVSEDVPAARLAEVAEEVAGELLESCEIIDVYRSPKLGAGKKSVTIGVSVASLEKTLTDTEAGEVRSRIIAEVEKALGAQLRAI